MKSKKIKKTTSNNNNNYIAAIFDIKVVSGLSHKNNKRRVTRNELKDTDDFRDTDKHAYYR